MKVKMTITFTDVTVLAELRRIVADTSHLGEDMTVLVESTPHGVQVIITDPAAPPEGCEMRSCGATPARPAVVTRRGTNEPLEILLCEEHSRPAHEWWPPGTRIKVQPWGSLGEPPVGAWHPAAKTG